VMAPIDVEGSIGVVRVLIGLRWKI
jgi:hypothetical protein